MSSEGRTPVHLTSQSGHTLHAESIEVSDCEAGLGDQPIDLPVQVTSATNHILNRIQPVLPRGDRSVIAPAMFQEEKSSSRFEDAPNFVQCKRRIGNRAERPGADDIIETSIGIGESLCGIPLDANRKREAGAACCDCFWKELGWINRMQLCDGRRIVLQIQTGSYPEF